MGKSHAMVVLAVAAMLALAWPTRLAATPASAPGPLCHRDQLYRVINYLNQPVTIRNDVFGAGQVCIDVSSRQRSWFRVGRTSAPPGGSIDAYPEIFYGCVYGKCTQGSVLPRPVTRTAGMLATWQTFRTRPSGLWNKAFDIWFSRSRHVGGQAAGAELMVWLDTTFARPAGRPVVSIAGRRYWFSWHRACNQAARLCWNFMIFRRVSPAAEVTKLPLTPFISYAERQHLIARSWWMENVEAGFELWSGGAGLGTSRFGVVP